MKKKDFAFRATGDLVAILEENRWRLKEPARRWDPMTRRITNDVWKPNIQEREVKGQCISVL